MKRTLLVCLLLLTASIGAHSQKYWNTSTMLQTYRLPMPDVTETPELLDLNNDGKQDAVSYHINGTMKLLWLDDDGNMRNGDLQGDFVNDCILVDRNGNGKYDFIVKHIDNDGDGKADLQFVFDYVKPHYMVVLDEDNDGVFNFIDWNTVTLECWRMNGLSDFYTDYSGNTSFLKMHARTTDMADLSYNWENPFIFYDYDNDGLTEIALRFCDQAVKKDGYKRRQYIGRMGWFSIGIDMDNDNCPGNDFDFDMTLHYSAQNAFEYHQEVHPIRNMRGLPEADKFFPDPRVRLIEELIYPDRTKAFKLAYGGKWESARFTWDEDDDCGRWERVELYQNKDAFAIGSKNNGVDNHNQADPAGDRGEWDEDFSGGGDIYLAPFDGRVHLYGAERGVWRIDQNTKYYQGWDRRFQNSAPTQFATVEYLDTDNNGFFDTLNFDLDGDCKYESVISLKELGIDDRCTVLDVSSMKYKDYTKLFQKVSKNMWKNAQQAVKVAQAKGVGTFWYGKLMNPATSREYYHDGWWLQFYIYKDLEHKILCDAHRENRDPEAELKTLRKAYFSGDWGSLL